MADHVKGRLIKPPTLFIDHVVFDIDDDGKAGHFELPTGAEVRPGDSYRVELADGRSGTVRVTTFNEISTFAQFVVEGEWS